MTSLLKLSAYIKNFNTFDVSKKETIAPIFSDECVGNENIVGFELLEGTAMENAASFIHDENMKAGGDRKGISEYFSEKMSEISPIVNKSLRSKTKKDVVEGLNDFGVICEPNSVKELLTSVLVLSSIDECEGEFFPDDFMCNISVGKFLDCYDEWTLTKSGMASTAEDMGLLFIEETGVPVLSDD